MDSKEKLAFRILASLYPDRKPSEVRKIIEDAMSKEVSSDDVELWIVLAKEKQEEPKEKIVERVIEHHHHDYYHYPWNIAYDTVPCTTTEYKITCTDSNSITSM